MELQVCITLWSICYFVILFIYLVMSLGDKYNTCNIIHVPTTKSSFYFMTQISTTHFSKEMLKMLNVISLKFGRLPISVKIYKYFYK